MVEEFLKLIGNDDPNECAKSRYFIWDDDDGHRFALPEKYLPIAEKLNSLSPITDFDSFEDFDLMFEQVFDRILGRSEVIRLEGGTLFFRQPEY